GWCSWLDFGASARNGAASGGPTPCYGAPVRRAAGAAEAADDYYALGATLCFAATGMDPVIVDADTAVNRDRTLAGLACTLPGDEHRQFRVVIGELMSLDPAVRTAGAERLRTGAPAVARAPGRLRFDDGLLEEIIGHTAAFCVEEAYRIADPVAAARAAVPTPIDVYGGSSGLGLELLHHLDRPGLRDAVEALAHWTAGQPRKLSPGFYSGRTGVELFLTEAHGASAASPAALPTLPGLPTLPASGPDGGPPEADLIEGVAGIGIGRLLLARHAGAGGHHALAARHLAVAAECDRMLASGTARLTPAGADTVGSAALREGLAHGAAGVAYFLLISRN
ncbi:serine/threonine protein kinase, partial [Kitasatospora sp. NPDC056531]